jgi:hydrogenase nickel incorporation protein HypA/HybF
MHELSIVQALVEQLEEVRRREQATRVVVCRIAVGRLSGVDPRSLSETFPIVADESEVAGVELRIEEIPVRLRCSACGVESLADGFVLRCPACGSDAVTVTTGRELHLVSVDLDVADATDAAPN